MQPQAGEVVQHAGSWTIGFLIMADRDIKERTDNLFDLTTAQP